MKKIWNILLTSLLLSSCSGMLDIDPHSAIPPGKTGNGDLSPMRMGMYGKVQNSPQRETYILFDIIGGNLRTGKTGNPRDLINTVLSPQVVGFRRLEWLLPSHLSSEQCVGDR